MSKSNERTKRNVGSRTHKQARAPRRGNGKVRSIRAGRRHPRSRAAHPRSSAVSLTIRQLQVLLSFPKASRRTTAIALSYRFTKRFGKWSRNGLYTTLQRLHRRGLLYSSGPRRLTKWRLTPLGSSHRNTALRSLK